MEKLVLTVNGMGCMKCVAKVENAVKDVPNVKKVKASLEDKNVTISYKDSLDKDLVIKKITEAGYEVE